MHAKDRCGSGNLPPETTAFIGREHQLTEIGQLMSRARLVTLTGPPGVGKTALARRATADARRGFLDGVWFVELDHPGDPRLLPHTLATGLGLREQVGRSPLEMLTQFLALRPAFLLVLDGCDRLPAGYPAFVEGLLADCPNLQILATSREPLAIAAEAVLAVPPLAAPLDPELSRPEAVEQCESVALLLDRAAAAPGFAPDDRDMRSVAAICHRLNGVPLAIELAAARLATSPTAQVLAELAAGPSGGAPYAQALDTCLDWTFHRCTPAARLLWARLSVFTAGFEPDAIELACTGGELAAEAIPAAIVELTDAAVLTRDQRGDVERYQLPEALREYGARVLRDAGEQASAERRHRDWTERLVLRAEADLVSTRQEDWQDRLDRELPNIRVALDRCLNDPAQAETGLRIVVALLVYWLRGRLGEGRLWLDRALDRQAGPATVSRVQAMHQATLLAGFQLDVEAASVLATQVGEIAGQVDDVRARTLATHAEGHLALFNGDFATAASRYDQVLEYYRAVDDRTNMLLALVPQSVALGLVCDWPKMTACHEEILAITEPQGELWFRSYALYGLGLGLWRQGETARAAGTLRESLRLKLLVDDPMGAGFCVDVLAWIAAVDGRYVRAAHLLGAADALSHVSEASVMTVPDVYHFHDECEQQTRGALGDSRYATAFRVGAELTFADAVDLALEESAVPVP